MSTPYSAQPRTFTPTWEDTEAWGQPTTEFERQAIAELRAYQKGLADSPTGGPACIVYDEEVKIREINLNNFGVGTLGSFRDTFILKDTDAFARQDDKGPYHWAQGPQDLTPITTTPIPSPIPPVTPSPRPEPVTPGQVPHKGQAITTTNLRLRRGPGTGHPSLGVLPVGVTVRLTGGVRMAENGRWVRVEVTESHGSFALRSPDVWVECPPPKRGWVNSAYLAVPASEYVMSDFPPLTHEYLWHLEDTGGLDREAVRKALVAISEDPRGPRRAGINVRESLTVTEAHVLIRMVDTACGGAAGCYYKRAGERARVDIGKDWFGTQWLSRVFLHETFGHAAGRCYDHYRNAPQYPREDYYGLMGNWQDQFGDHAWPDEDDIANMRQWALGKSDLVFVRDLG